MCTSDVVLLRVRGLFFLMTHSYSGPTIAVMLSYDRLQLYRVAIVPDSIFH